MKVKDRLLKEIQTLDEESTRWILGLIQRSRGNQIRKKLLEAAGKGILQIPLRINANSIEPIRGKGKPLSEIVLEQR